MQHCLICQAGDYGSVTRAVTVPDALERLGSILRFLFNYHEDLATGRPQARRTKDFDLRTLAALLDTQTNFQEQLKVPETPAAENRPDHIELCTSRQPDRSGLNRCPPFQGAAMTTDFIKHYDRWILEAATAGFYANGYVVNRADLEKAVPAIKRQHRN